MKRTRNKPARVAIALAMMVMMTTQALALEVPVSQTEQVVNGQQTLVKVFEVSPDFDPQQLVEEGLQQNGYNYIMTSIVKDVVSEEDSQDVTQEQAIVIENSDEDEARIEALKTMPPFIEYEKDGYKGKLFPMPNTLELTEAGRSSHSGSQKTTRSYTYEYNDDSLIPQTVTEGGKTYTKSSVTWAEGSYMDGSAIPENYVANVTYTRNYSYSTVDGYNATMIYSGTVEKEDDTMVRYTVTYLGTPVEAPDEGISPVGIATIIVCVAAVVAVIVVIILLTKRNKIHIPTQKS